MRALGARVAEGLQVTGVPTSIATAELARELEIPLLSLEQAGRLDVTFDGADEVDPNLDLIKGYGGAHVREKIVAACSEQLVILVGAEKLVDVLGSRGKLPVEVLPFGEALCRRALARDRLRGQSCASAENGEPPGHRQRQPHSRLPRSFGHRRRKAALERDILAIPGVLGTGLFVGMADAVIVQDGDRVELRRRARTPS